MSDSDSSDVSMSEDSGEDSNFEVSDEEDEAKSAENPEGALNEEDEEDEVIKSIIKERNKPRDHPPDIECEDEVNCLCFHPQQDLLACAMMTGDVLFYKYSIDSNELIETHELHEKSCRVVIFNEDGTLMYSGGKDKTIMLTDVASGQLIKFYENAHSSPIYCLREVNKNIFATGDEDGEIKVWDKRVDKTVFSIKKNEDLISDMITNDDKKFLVCTSGDGSLLTVDVRGRKFHTHSEEYDAELNCVGLFHEDRKLAVGASNGKLYMFNWGEFGLHSDEFPGPKSAINAMIPITDNICVTACEDGILRATHLFPHKYLGIVGQHDLSVETVDICNDGSFIASAGYDSTIKFWNIQYFEDFDKSCLGEAKNTKSTKKNLPSSKCQNASDFFDGLVS